MPVETWHPMTVHFPIALLLVAFLVETLALVFTRPAWHRITLWNLVLGAWAALAAAVTGGLAAVMAKHPSWESHAVLAQHSVWGALVFVAAVVVAGWHLAAGQEMSRRARWISWGLLGMTCVMTAFAAHLGAKLVFEYGVIRVDLP